VRLLVANHDEKAEIVVVEKLALRSPPGFPVPPANILEAAWVFAVFEIKSAFI
jgi:hypothetical protein